MTVGKKDLPISSESRGMENWIRYISLRNDLIRLNILYSLFMYVIKLMYMYLTIYHRLLNLL